MEANTIEVLRCMQMQTKCHVLEKFTHKNRVIFAKKHNSPKNTQTRFQVDVRRFYK